MVAALLAALAIAVAHPLHTTLTEVTINPANHTVRAVVRVFSDDLGSAIAKRIGAGPATGVTDVQAAAYVVAQLAVTDRSANAVALRSCGVKRSGDLLWICVEGTMADVRGATLRNALLCDLFNDQVNIVQVAAAQGIAARSVLFTRGDGAKTLL